MSHGTSYCLMDLQTHGTVHKVTSSESKSSLAIHFINTLGHWAALSRKGKRMKSSNNFPSFRFYNQTIKLTKIVSLIVLLVLISAVFQVGSILKVIVSLSSHLTLCCFSIMFRYLTASQDKNTDFCNVLSVFYQLAAPVN